MEITSNNERGGMVEWIPHFKNIKPSQRPPRPWFESWSHHEITWSIRYWRELASINNDEGKDANSQNHPKINELPNCIRNDNDEPLKEIYELMIKDRYPTPRRTEWQKLWAVRYNTAIPKVSTTKEAPDARSVATYGKKQAHSLKV
ncbi:hypothetical protein ACTFIU_010148 [Dictyostelium citrinum]